MTPCPKPEKPIRGTAGAKKHMERVAQLPCVICKRWPVIVHHCICDRYANRRASDFETIPLCPRHHDETSPEGIHKSKDAWAAKHGADHEYLDWVTAEIYGEKR